MLSLLRRNRDFRTLFLAQIVSYAGDWFATVAVLGLVRERTQNDLYATLVFVSQSLPAFFLSPLAGPVADRSNRKTVLLVVSVLQVGCALVFLGAVHGPVALVFVAQGAISAFGAFFAPASQASIANLVDEADLADATSLIGATWGTMVAVGAGLGAIFTAVFGRTASFIADAVSFAIAAALIASIRRPLSARAAADRPKMRPIADTVEGLRYARGNRTVTALLMSKAGFGMASGMVGLLAVLADVRFHQRERGAGFLLACRGVGVVAGPFLARRFARGSIERVLYICGLSALLSGAMYSLVPWSPALAVAGPLVLVAHLGGGTQWTLSSYGLQISTPDELRGRIFATDFALITFTMTASLIAAGVLSNHFGPEPIMAALAAVNIAWGIGYLLFTQPIRARAAALR